MKKAKIIGLGSYLPQRILSNYDLEKLVDTTDEWIYSRTGMKERRIAAPNEFTSDMGLLAAQKALSDASISVDQIDCIVVATLSPDYLCPSTACLIQHGLNASHVAAFDVQAACSGYLYALAIAKSLVESGLYNNVLVVASEKLSSLTNYEDRSTCILFGDGAAACVVSSQGKGLWITSLCLGSDGQQANLITVPAGGCRAPASSQTVEEKKHFFHMLGNEVFKHAVRRMEMACKDCLDLANLEESSISWLVPHQANSRIIDALSKRFNHLPAERIVKTVHKYGNTSCSSIGIALDELHLEKKILPGEYLLLTAFGGGLTWGATILQADL